MAEKVEAKNDLTEILQLVSFLIGNEEFGVEILYVQEINRMLPITKVPNSPEFVEGVVNLRGRVIPVIDLRRKLGMSRKEHDKNTRIIVVEVNGNTIGFIVDAVKEVVRIPKSIIEPPPELVAGVDAEFIRSVCKLEDRLLILIDLTKIISAKVYDEVKTVA